MNSVYRQRRYCKSLRILKNTKNSKQSNNKKRIQMEMQYIEKLNALNYKYWTIMTRAYLEKEDLMDTIDRKDPASNTIAKERRARFILLCLIEPSFVRELPDNVRSAREIWTHFAFRYRRRRSASCSHTS
ncbi:PREDICTED: uncharacterized protein LOC108966661 [Bactrocera latifrons]|uniref:uncharacterized protein LOC108966661 n=1 Tax=Bactrocera latifrons TaxID=174628 RepID=UPI0008DDBA2B|nr:PREDICTED: uncharacterized protein LOC108966661 [Bactrocera latifrons]